MRGADAGHIGWLFLIALLLSLSSPAAAEHEFNDRKVELGLFGSLPIYWGEGEELSALIADAQHPGWIRQELEQRYRLRLLDVLGASGGANPLGGIGFLMLAQPRALAPVENVALDQWVRDGGRLLLFVDPMLTAHSAFGLGDRRRPQDVALLSPLLAHWGLELLFDEEQQDAERAIDLFGVTVPVQLSGSFALIDQHEYAADDDQSCALYAEGLMTECAIGKGYALIIADAALLDDARGGSKADRQALAMLLDRVFRGNHGQ